MTGKKGQWREALRRTERRRHETNLKEKKQRKKDEIKRRGWRESTRERKWWEWEKKVRVKQRGSSGTSSRTQCSCSPICHRPQQSHGCRPTGLCFNPHGPHQAQQTFIIISATTTIIISLLPQGWGQEGGLKTQWKDQRIISVQQRQEASSQFYMFLTEYANKLNVAGGDQSRASSELNLMLLWLLFFLWHFWLTLINL